MLVAVNESFLDAASGTPCLTGYIIIARRDRDSPPGGMIVFGGDDVADLFTHLHSSATQERMWIVAHCDIGPLLLCV
eukprot:7850650-Alexandrium_andersonii.AAC.1